MLAISELPSFTLAVKFAFASPPRVTISEKACRAQPALLVFSQWPVLLDASRSLARPSTSWESG